MTAQGRQPACSADSPVIAHARRRIALRSGTCSGRFAPQRANGTVQPLVAQVSVLSVCGQFMACLSDL